MPWSEGRSRLTAPGGTIGGAACSVPWGVAFEGAVGVLVDAGGGVDHRSLTRPAGANRWSPTAPSAGPSTRLHRAARGMIATRIVETASQTIDVLE